jgi:hypothetical protein
VFDDFSVVSQAEYIDSSVVMVAGPVLEAVQDDKLPIVEDALEFNPLPQPLALHPLEIVDEALLTVRDAGLC